MCPGRREGGPDAAWDIRWYLAIVASGVGRHHQRLAGGVEGDGHVRVHRFAQGHHGLEVPHVESRIAGRTPTIAEVQEYVAAQVQLRVQLFVAVPCKSAKYVAWSSQEFGTCSTTSGSSAFAIQQGCWNQRDLCLLAAVHHRSHAGLMPKAKSVKLTRQGLRKVVGQDRGRGQVRGSTLGRVLIAVQAHVTAAPGFRLGHDGHLVQRRLEAAQKPAQREQSCTSRQRTAKSFCMTFRLAMRQSTYGWATAQRS